VHALHAQLDRCVLADLSPLEAWLAGLHIIIHVRCINMIKVVVSLLQYKCHCCSHLVHTLKEYSGILNVHKTQTMQS
jgi:hypothetical protein